MLIFLILYVLKKIIFAKEQLVFGVYRKNTRYYWPKYLLIITFLYFRKLYLKVSGKNNSNDYINKYEKLVDISKLSSHAADSVFFTGTNNKGYRFLFSIERRKNGVFYGVVYVIIPNRGILKLPQMPDSLFFSNFGQESTIHGKPNFKAECIEPLKKWKLEYNGQLINEFREESLVQLSAEYTSNFDVFNYDTDLSINAIANGIAMEKWNSNLFRELKEPNQHFYEQMGNINVNLSIDGETSEFQLQGFRDHGFGNVRDWGSFHRYALFILFLKNNTSIHIGFACKPGFITNILTGYVCTDDGKYHPISWSDFELYQNGENGDPPKDHAFSFVANETTYLVQLCYEHQFEHFVGDDWDARIIDRFVQANVNDISGYGIVEYQYKNKTGRPDAYTENDPKDFKKIQKEKIN